MAQTKRTNRDSTEENLQKNIESFGLESQVTLNKALGGDQMLFFRAGSLWLAFLVKYVDQLHPPVPSTPIPLSPPYVLGLINFRGEVVPLIDLAIFLDIPISESSKNSSSFERIAIVEAHKMRVGIKCEEIKGILSLQSSVQEVVVTRGHKVGNVALGEVQFQEHIVVLIDLPKLLNEAMVKV